MRRLRLLAFVPWFALAASWAAAAVVNVDFVLLGEPTQTGNVGILSTTGTVWNGVVVDSDAALLADEFGVPTSIDLAFLEPTDPYAELTAGSDLRRSGITGAGFEVQNLLPDSTYTLAVYAPANTSFTVQHGSGTSGGPCTSGGPSFMLPGQEGKDYCLFTDLAPLDLGDGTYGIRVVNLDGAITGFQLLGPAGGEPPPPEDRTPPECTLAGDTGSADARVEIQIQDAESGLASVTVTVADNVTVTVSPFTPGTTDAVIVTASPIDSGIPGTVEIASADVAGNAGTCGVQFPPSSGCTSIQECCRELLSFFENAKVGGTLVGSGPGKSARGRLGALGNMLKAACAEIGDGRSEDACDQLGAALKKTDGDVRPPDFAGGPAAPELAARIQALRAALGCDGAVTESVRRSLRPTVSIREGSWGMIKARYGSTGGD